MPLDIFIDCLVDSDLSGLIIEGAPEQSELQHAWDKIYTQSCELGHGDQYNEVMELMREIEYIRGKITIVNNSIQYFVLFDKIRNELKKEMTFNNDLVNILNSFALRCNIVPEDTGESLIIKLNNIIARMKKWIPILTSKEKALADIRSKSTGKTDRNYFGSWLDAMSESKGYHVRANEITVARFYMAMIKMKAEEQRAEMRNLIKQ